MHNLCGMHRIAVPLILAYIPNTAARPLQYNSQPLAKADRTDQRH